MSNGRCADCCNEIEDEDDERQWECPNLDQHPLMAYCGACHEEITGGAA